MILVAIDINVKQRETDWICVCPVCQHERIVSYAQKWNIETGKSSDKCKSCRLELGETKLNIDGLNLGRKKNKSVKGFSNKGTLYRNLFVEVSDQAKEKQRAAKLGKFGSECNAWDGGPTELKKIHRKKLQKEYKKKRLKEDKVFYAMKIVRDRVASFIKQKNLKSKNKKLGCDLKTFKIHIESQFQPEMTWDNYGKWHLDHIFPLSVAAKISNEKFLEACHYTNLQPLWAADNIRKGCAIWG